jgi:hypothetical protein
MRRQNTSCISGDAIRLDDFSTYTQLFSGTAPAEQSDPAPMSDDSGYALYVLYDSAHHIVFAKVTNSPKILAGAPGAYVDYVLMTIAQRPARISKGLDLSRVKTAAGLSLHSTLHDVLTTYGHRAHVSSACWTEMTFVFSRWTSPAGGVQVGDPKSTISMNLRLGHVARIEYVQTAGSD